MSTTIRLLSCRQIEDMTGASRRFVADEIRHGRLAGDRVGTAYAVTDRDLLRWYRDHSQIVIARLERQVER